MPETSNKTPEPPLNWQKQERPAESKEAELVRTGNVLVLTLRCGNDGEASGLEAMLRQAFNV